MGKVQVTIHLKKCKESYVNSYPTIISRYNDYPNMNINQYIFWRKTEEYIFLKLRWIKFFSFFKKKLYFLLYFRVYATRTSEVVLVVKNMLMQET